LRSFQILDMLPRSRDIRDQSLKWYKIDRSFACFWPFGGIAPEFLDLHFKIQPVSDHAAKFHSDRPRDLGDLALKKKERKKTSRVKHKPARNEIMKILCLTFYVPPKLIDISVCAKLYKLIILS